MTSLILVAILAATNPDPMFRQSDGGLTYRVWADGVSASSSSGGVTNAELRAAPIFVIVDAGSVSVNNFPASQPVTGTFWQATQPVSIASMPSTPVTGTFWQATQPVSGPLTDTQLRTSPVPIGFDGGLVSAAQSGTWSVRAVGNAGAAVDAANNATAPANVLVAGAQLQSGAAATNGTAGQVGSVVAGLDHVLYARLGGPVVWSCFVPLTTTATTQCQAAPGAGLRAYVTSMTCSNGAATVQGVDIVFGTGANCGTGTTALTHKYQMGTNQLTTSPFQVSQTYVTGLVPTAATAICVRPTAATAFGCTLTGFTAP